MHACMHVCICIGLPLNMVERPSCMCWDRTMSSSIIEMHRGPYRSLRRSTIQGSILLLFLLHRPGNPQPPSDSISPNALQIPIRCLKNLMKSGMKRLRDIPRTLRPEQTLQVPYASRYRTSSHETFINSARYIQSLYKAGKRQYNKRPKSQSQNMYTKNPKNPKSV